MCHPNLRLHYFEKVLGKYEYNRAEIIFKEIYNKYEREQDESAQTPLTTLDPTLRQSSIAMSDFEDITMLSTTENSYGAQLRKSEFDRYCILGEGSQSGTEDSLLWWKVCFFRSFFLSFFQ